MWTCKTLNNYIISQTFIINTAGFCGNGDTHKLFKPVCVVIIITVFEEMKSMEVYTARLTLQWFVCSR